MASLTLAQAALLTQDDLVMGVVKEIITVDLFASIIPFVPSASANKVVNQELTESGSGFLDINSTTNPTQSTFTRTSFPLGRIVGDVEVDDFEQATQSRFNDQMGIQTELKSKSIGRVYKAAIITGTGSFPQFTGMSNLMDASGVIQASSTTTAGALTLALLDELLDTVKSKDGEVDYIIMNSAMRRKYKALVRSQGFDNDEVEIGFLDPLSGQRGTGKVIGYENIPIFKNDNIGTESTNGSPDKQRIFAGVFGEGVGLVGLQPGVGDPGIRVSVPFIHPTKDATVRRVKFYTGLALYNKWGLAELSNLTSA